MPSVKSSRNAPCPCGSGQKFKRCCYRKDELWQRGGSVLPAWPPAHNSEAGAVFPARLTPAGHPLTTPGERRSWQQVHVVLDGADGRRTYAVLLHSEQWLRARRAVEGGTLTLDLPRHGVRGEGRVTRVEPSPGLRRRGPSDDLRPADENVR